MLLGGNFCHLSFLFCLTLEHVSWKWAQVYGAYSHLDFDSLVASFAALN